MSHICRLCADDMPKDRKGDDQICPKCIKKIMTKKVERGITADSTQGMKRGVK